MRHCIMVYGLVFCIVMNYMGFGWYPLCLVLLYPGVGMRCFLFRFLGWLRTWLSGNRCATWFCRSWSFCCLDCPSIFLGLFLRIFFRFCLSVSVGLFAVSLCFFLCISLSFFYCYIVFCAVLCAVLGRFRVFLVGSGINLFFGLCIDHG